MLKLYCQSCGSLNVYSKQKPNFCQGCGQGFGSIGVPQNLKSKMESQAGQGLGDDNTKIYEIPNIDGLIVDIDVRGPQTDTIGGIAGSDKSGNSTRAINAGASDYDVMEEFKREASSLRPPP